MSQPSILVQENIDYLQQAERLVTQLSDAVFTHTDLPPFNSAVGMHLRHILDFYTAFLQRQDHRIDYDARHRDRRVESDRQAARQRIHSTCQALATVAALDTEVWCKNDEMAAPRPAAVFRRSTVGRELQFLASHTVHHFAMIALLLSAQGVKTPPGFGVAPSTLAHWKETGSRPLG